VRIEWLPISASALVTGVMALVLGALLNPTMQEQDPAATLGVVSQHGGRWLGMAVLFFLASVALTLGLPAMLTLFTRRGRVLGLLGVGIFSVGAIGTSGYAMLMVFFRALVENDAVRPAPLEAVVGDVGLSVFLYTWVGCFYGGLFVIALALFRARKTALWVPALLLVYLATTPMANQAGRVGMTMQLLLLAIAFTGVATAANAPGQRSGLGQEAAAV
jgi:hypothetical protein